MATLTALSLISPVVGVGAETPNPGTDALKLESASASQSADDEPDAFQIDLVQGDVIRQLDPEKNDTYHAQDRFISALLITENERQRGGPGTPKRHTYRSDGCEVSYTQLSFDNATGESQVAVSVADAGGCEGITLSYAGYELPDGTAEYDWEQADEQELKDSVTRTLNPGDSTTFTIDVIDEESSTAATYEVTGVSAPDVTQGDTASVTATIENTGDTEGTQTVSLTVAGENIALSSEETLAAGASTDVTFEIDSSSLSPGTYDVTIETADDTATTTLTVTEPAPATFEITDVSAPDVKQGDTATITATIENTGDVTGTQNVTYQLVGENITTGTSAVDVVFVLDQSGSMSDDNQVMRQNLKTFTNELERQNIDARYAVISMERPATVTQDFTSDVNETQRSFDSIIRASGFIEDNYDALAIALDLLNQEGRPGAQRVIIDITDEDSDTQAGTPSQQELSDRLNATGTSYIAVTPNASNLFSTQPELQKRPLANMTQDGTWYDLIAGDFGERFTDEIAQRVVNRTRSDNEPITLNATESAEKTFSFDTSNLPPGTYDVTVSTEDDTETTTLEVRP